MLFCCHCSTPCFVFSDIWHILYYSLKICVPAKFVCWNPYVQCDGVRGGTFRGFFGHEDGTLRNVIAEGPRFPQGPWILPLCEQTRNPESSEGTYSILLLLVSPISDFQHPGLLLVTQPVVVCFGSPTAQDVLIPEVVVLLAIH